MLLSTTEGYSISDIVTIGQYQNDLIAEIKKHQWRWFLTLNTQTYDLPKAYDYTQKYLRSVGGLSKGKWDYAFAICQHKSSYNRTGITPYHIHGFLSASTHLSGKTLTSVWKKKSYLPTRSPSGNKLYTKSLIGRTNIKRYRTEMGGIEYSINQMALGVLFTNVPSIQRIQEKHR